MVAHRMCLDGLARSTHWEVFVIHQDMLFRHLLRRISIDAHIVCSFFTLTE